MTAKDIKIATRRIARIRKLMSAAKSPLHGLSKQEAIEQIRKTREKLWEAKLASHS